MGVGDKAHAKKLSKSMGVDGVGLYFCICDSFQVFCMSEGDGNTKGTQNVTKPIPITCAFDNGTMRIGPLTEIRSKSIRFSFDSRSGNNSSSVIDCAHHDKTPVQIDSSVQHKPSCEFVNNPLIRFGNQSYEFLLTHGRPF